MAENKDKKNSDVSSSDETEGRNIIAPKNWYILKVQVNREESVKRRLEDRVKMSGLGEFITDIIVPTETVVEVRGNKPKEIKKKLYPGYIIVNMEINDDTWFLVRETPGIGDFTSANGKPVPMGEYEVQRLLQSEKAGTDEAPKLNVKYSVGDKVRIKEGAFETYEGEVTQIDSDTGKVTVIVPVFGRSTPTTLDCWQIESIG